MKSLAKKSLNPRRKGEDLRGRPRASKVHYMCDAEANQAVAKWVESIEESQKAWEPEPEVKAMLDERAMPTERGLGSEYEEVVKKQYDDN